MLNENTYKAAVSRNGKRIGLYDVKFEIDVQYLAGTEQEIKKTIESNVDIKNNYFRVESFTDEEESGTSYVDGLGSNTGFFRYNQIVESGYTTIVHEYLHTLGIWQGKNAHEDSHPYNLNLIGKGQPGMMYIERTLVDRQHQVNPKAEQGDYVNGGHLDIRKRKVTAADIYNIFYKQIKLINGLADVGKLTSKYHAP